MTNEKPDDFSGSEPINPKLQRILDEIKQIPPTPRIIPKLKKLLDSPDSDTEDLINLLKVDAPTTAQIIKMANSSYYGLSQPVRGLQEAIYLIGFNKIWKIVSLAATRDLMSKPLPLYHTQKGELLEQSIASAQIMDSIAEVKGMAHSESYYTSGLLHDIGKVVMNQYFTQWGLIAFGGTFENDPETNEVSLEDEQRLFGFDHAQAGSALLQKWNFAEEIYTSIRYQYTPEVCAHYSQLSFSLLLARQIAPRLVESTEVLAKCPDLEPLQLACKISDEQLEEVLKQSFKKYQNTKLILNG